MAKLQDTHNNLSIYVHVKKYIFLLEKILWEEAYWLQFYPDFCKKLYMIRAINRKLNYINRRFI